MSKLILTEEATTPTPPSTGQDSLYVKTDHVLYVLSAGGVETPIGSSNSITQLTGDVTATGPGVTPATVAFVGGESAADVAAAVVTVENATPANTASQLVQRDGSGNFSAHIITASLNGNASTATSASSAISFTGPLAGDVTGNQSSTVVSTVGGQSASAVAAAAVAVAAATPVNIATTLVERDASGNFGAGTVTANLTGNVMGNLTGNVTGNVSGTSANVTGVVAIANGGTNSSATLNNHRVIQSSAGQIVEAAAISPNQALISDGNGIPTQSVTTATELSYVSGVTSSIQAQINSVGGSAITALTGDVSAAGPGSVAATVNSVGGSSAANIHSAELAANAATDADTPSTIVKRDSSGNFSAGTITASLTGHASADVPLTYIGAANGVASLDSSALVPIAELPTGTPVSQTPNQSNSAGTALTVAKSDHIHNIPTATPVQIGTSNSQGSAASFSNSDHIHAHGAQTDPTLHAVVTDSLNGFMSSVDKTKLDASTALDTASTLVMRDGSGSFAATGISLTGALTSTFSSIDAVTLNSTSFIFDTVNNSLGIGVQPSTSVMIDGVNTSGASKLVQMTGYGIGSTTGYRGRFARGTLGTPSAAQAGDNLSAISGRGYGTSQFAAASTGVMNIVAGETFTNASNATYLTLSSTPTGSVTAAERMRINSTGNILIGTTTDNATDLVQLAAGIISSYHKLAGSISGYFQQSPAATTTTYGIVWPASQGAGGSVPTNDGSGNLSWVNPQVNIDGGTAGAVYTSGQFINGGTP